MHCRANVHSSFYYAVGVMQPKEAKLGSFKNTVPVVAKVSKIINMPSEYFVECIENEKKFKNQISDDDDDDDDDDVDDNDGCGDDDYDYDSGCGDTETKQGSIKGIKSDDDDCNTSTTSGYISDVTETGTVVSLDNTSITDTDTLFVSNSKDSFNNMSTNDEVAAANNFVQGDNDRASGNFKTELSLDEYTWEVECTKVFWKSFKK